jgi:ubiquinone/menaquinone biosynthesis C-methylase UbiE
MSTARYALQINIRGALKMSTNTEEVSWKNIWERKGDVASNHIELKNLIAIDGFDTGAGEFSVNSWLSFVKEIQERLNIRETKRVLEVGCGAGAFLFPMSNSNIEIFGIDYSISLVELCSKIMPSGIFKVAEAKSLPFEDLFFDVILSNSVFQYFESLNYAENVVNEMARLLNSAGHIALLDINDASKEYEYESIRRAKLGDDEYDRLYGSLTHQFYKKEWFEHIADHLNLKCIIMDQNIIGYENSKFRYNVFLSRED